MYFSKNIVGRYQFKKRVFRFQFYVSDNIALSSKKGSLAPRGLLFFSFAFLLSQTNF